VHLHLVGGDKAEKPFVHIANVAETSVVPLHSHRASDANETFHVAKEAWTILHALETFEKGKQSDIVSAFLTKRITCLMCHHSLSYLYFTALFFT